MRGVMLAAALLLAGCSEAAQDVSRESAPASPEMATPSGPVAQRLEARPAADADVAGATAGAAAAPAPLTAASVPLLAYVYTAAIEAPAKAVRPLAQRHEAACANAGPQVCQVTAVNVGAEGRDSVTAELTLRARPDWLRRFRNGLEGDARGAGGRVTGSGTETEDLTRAIVDTEARLRAQTALRDRLEKLLAERPGKLEDVLKVEQELARVQGEIDAMASGLAVMRTRVQTSTLTVSYRSAGVAAPDGVWAPLGSALRDALRNVVLGLAGLVTLLSWLLPFIALVAGGVWLWLRLRPRRKPKTQPPAA